MLRLPPELVTPPAAATAIVSLAEAKAHLRVDDDEQDGQIEAMIAAAVGHLDGYSGILGRALLAQDWKQFGAFWPASRIIGLTLAPVIEIVSVAAQGADGQSVTVDPALYRLVGAASRPGLLFRIDAALPSLNGEPDAVAVTYRAGYGETGADVPPALRSEILLMVGDLWRFRDSVAMAGVAVPMSTTVDRRIAPFRRVTF